MIRVGKGCINETLIKYIESYHYVENKEGKSIPSVEVVFIDDTSAVFKDVDIEILLKELKDVGVLL